jgi:hypothetical protein
VKKYRIKSLAKLFSSAASPQVVTCWKRMHNDSLAAVQPASLCAMRISSPQLEKKEHSNVQIKPK